MGIRYTMYKIGVHQWKEKFMFKVAWWMPNWLVYMCTIRLMAHVSTTLEYSNTHPDDIGGMDALKKFGNDFGIH